MIDPSSQPSAGPATPVDDAQEAVERQILRETTMLLAGKRGEDDEFVLAVSAHFEASDSLTEHDLKILLVQGGKGKA